MKALILALISLLSLIGCAPTTPFRTSLVEPGSVNCPSRQAEHLKQCANITPETGEGYELHFVEFDDQGWAASLDGNKVKPDARAESQTDHLMKRLRSLLDTDEYLNIILYVHGWQHEASTGDRDVRRFREILASTAALQLRSAHKPRKTVGIYIGWRGNSWMLPGSRNLSFWSRKATALRVSNGAVQELFARVRTIQQYYNTVFDSQDCMAPAEGVLTTGGCRVRTLMIGHSFGAWILYSAMAPQIISALNAERDVDNQPSSRKDMPLKINPENAKKIVNRRPAEMIVLINPAFEAVRYQPVHRAAINYRTRSAQPPLLVTISSSADVATRTFFPAGRFINTIFERPTTSAEQSRAMTRTHGNLDEYYTHRLSMLKTDTCNGWKPPGALSTTNKDEMIKNKEIEIKNASQFFLQYKGEDGRLKPWVRDFCGGLRLSLLGSEPNSSVNRDPNSLVWNIRTDEEVIPAHSDIIEAQFLEFVRQLYADTELRK